MADEEKSEKQLGTMESELKALGARIDELIATADRVGADAAVGYRESIEDLKVKRAVAQARFDEFKAAGAGKWEHFKAGVESAWKELEGAFKGLKR